MYDFGIPPANTVAGDILRRAPPQLDASDGMVLANFTVASDDLTWVTTVSTAILSLTIIGATAILGTMAYLEYKGRPGTTRQRIVQSLVLSDLILGIVGLIGSALELAGRPLEAGTSTCDGLGFMLITILWTEHLWTLSLAVATFLILIYPLHSATILLERHWYILWLFVWAVAIAVAITGLEIFGFYPAGGICYYGTNAGLYAELIQFIPRGLVFVVISILYWRLFVFLRRPDRIRGSFSDSTNSARRGRLSNVLARHSGGKLTGLFGRIIGAPQPKTASEDERLRAEKIVRVESRAPRGSGLGGAGKDEGGRPTRIDLPQAGRPKGWPRTDRATHGGDAEKLVAEALDEGQLSPGTVPPMSPKTIGTPGAATPTQVPAPAEIPPWEKVQLPVFEVDGQRFGGNAANTAPRQSDGLWSNWKGLGAPRDGKRRPGTGSSSTGGSVRHAPPFHRPSTATATSEGASSRSRSPQMQARNQSDASGTLADQPVPAAAGTADGRPRWSSVQMDTTADWSDKDRLRKVSAASAGSATPSMSFGNLLGVPRSGAGQGRSASPALDASVDSRRTSATETARGLPASAPPIAGTYRLDGAVPPSETGSGVTTPRRRPSDMNMDLEAGPTRLPNPADADSDVDDDEDGDDSDDRLDFLCFLREDGPHGSGNGPSASRGRWDGSGSSAEEYEFVEESMSSYLNRKTALLMLWFPLGYVLLFSVSLIRIIYDFVGNPPAELRAVSRWFIFAQGILDAIIYGVVEWHTKRVVRKRVRKGIFSPHGSRSARNGSQQGSFPGLTSALRGLRGSGSRDATTSGGGGGGGGNGATSSHRGRLRSQGGFGGASQLSYGQQGSPIAEEDPKTLMQAMDAISAPTNRATPPTAHGLRIGNLPAGMIQDGSDLAADQRRGSEAPSVGSQLTRGSLSAGSMTSNGASTKVSNSSARKGEDGVKRLDYGEPRKGDS